MHNYVKQLDSDINVDLLATEIRDLVTSQNLLNELQISLTSKTGSNDWLVSIGRTSSITMPESEYNQINNYLKGTYIEECILRYPEYYRWRILKMLPKTAYSIHDDKLYPDKESIRLHIPVITNPTSLMYFYNEDDWTAKIFHLDAGNTYETNTTRLHCAINHGEKDRVHIVGVKHA